MSPLKYETCPDCGFESCIGNHRPGCPTLARRVPACPCISPGDHHDRGCAQYKEPSPSLTQSPPHYIAGRRFEPADVVIDWNLSWALGSALKYIARCGRKQGADPVQDLEKCLWFIQREIRRLKEGK